MTLPGLRPIPLLGRTGGLARFFSDPIGALHRLRVLGDVVALNRGDPTLIAAFGAAHNRVVLSDSARFQHFADPPFPVPPASSAARLMNALTSMNGEHHRRHRRLMQPAFSRTAVEGYRDATVEVTRRYLDRWRPDRQVDLVEEMVQLTLRVAARTLFGIDVDDDAAAFGDLSLRVLTGLTDVRNMLFPVRWGPTPMARYLRDCEVMEAKLRALLAERRARAGQGRDVLSLLIAAHDDDGAALTDDELIGHTNVLFIAGHETTAFTLAWTLLLLAQHPDVADALDAELARLPGPPEVGDLAALPVLDGVLKESMRLLPATPFLFIRQADGGAEIGGHALPPGAWLLLSPLITHRDPDRFPDPLAFRPARWEGLAPTPHEYLPFGAGPRMCLGAGFAAQTLRLVLPMILRDWRPELPPAGVRVDLRTQGITMGPAPALPATLRRPGGPR
ncbi:MAG TPA: cytochrome P450, partial [Myxococcota bacterium]|nr:cytochrome P450 [Myxococcota bacterium]